MRQIIFIIFIIFILFPTLATARCTGCEIQEFSQTFNSSDKAQEIQDIINYVDTNITYKFYWYPRNIEDIWSERVGDCSDRATLKRVLLADIGVKTQPLHGFCDGFKHDYLEFRYQGEWYVDSNWYCNELVEMGSGYW